MQMMTYTYSSEEALKTFIQKKKLYTHKNVLIQIFSGILNKKLLLNISSILKNDLKHASIIGTTTAGEIDNSNMQDETILISFSIFEKTEVRSQLYTFDAYNPLESLQEELITDNTKAMIIFSDGLNSNTELFVRELYKVCPNIMIAGGRAGDNSKFEETFVFNEIDSTDNGCVIATLSSDILNVHTDYILKWTAIGKEMLITKCKGNVIYELDGVGIIDVYEKYLGSDVVKNLPSSCMPFPLITQKGSVTVARNPVSVIDKKALMYAGHFEEGEHVRFSFANICDLTDNMQEHFDALLKFPSEAVYIYSCLARRVLLEDKLQDELNLLASLAPCAGFFTYGEFYQSKEMRELLNVTTTFMILSESKELHKRSLKKIPELSADPIRKALTNLVTVTTNELEKISTHDILTSLYNRAEYLKHIRQSILSAQRYNESFGVVLIDVDNFKQINDNYGHLVGDKVLQAFSKVLQKSVRANDFLGRWGGEEFVIIVKHIQSKALENLVVKLQKNINSTRILDLPLITVSCGVSLYRDGDTDESIFKRVDKALYLAKSNGRNCYIVV